MKTSELFAICVIMCFIYCFTLLKLHVQSEDIFFHFMPECATCDTCSSVCPMSTDAITCLLLPPYLFTSHFDRHTKLCTPSTMHINLCTVHTTQQYDITYHSLPLSDTLCSCGSLCTPPATWLYNTDCSGIVPMIYSNLWRALSIIPGHRKPTSHCVPLLFYNPVKPNHIIFHQICFSRK